MSLDPKTFISPAILQSYLDSGQISNLELERWKATRAVIEKVWLPSAFLSLVASSAICGGRVVTKKIPDLKQSLYKIQLPSFTRMILVLPLTYTAVKVVAQALVKSAIYQPNDVRVGNLMKEMQIKSVSNVLSTWKAAKSGRDKSLEDSNPGDGFQPDHSFSTNTMFPFDRDNMQNNMNNVFPSDPNLNGSNTEDAWNRVRQQNQNTQQRWSSDSSPKSTISSNQTSIDKMRARGKIDDIDHAVTNAFDAAGDDARLREERIIAARMSRSSD